MPPSTCSIGNLLEPITDTGLGFWTVKCNECIGSLFPQISQTPVWCWASRCAQWMQLEGRQVGTCRHGVSTVAEQCGPVSIPACIIPCRCQRCRLQSVQWFAPNSDTWDVVEQELSSVLPWLIWSQTPLLPYPLHGLERELLYSSLKFQKYWKHISRI